MKKSIIIIAIIAIILIIFIGIQMIFKDANKNINIDMQKLTDELINAQIFEDDLSSIDRESIIKKYSFNSEKIKNISSSVGTGATAEEILIIELVDKKDVKDVKELKEIIEKKIEERKADFQDYLPKEVSKLENYNLECKGNYIILCISNNYDKAKEVINKHINS